MSDLYYNPKAYGLEVVGEVDCSDGAYQFDLFVVWYDPKQDDYFWGADSGCSCPTPFEDEDLSTLARGTAKDVLTDLKAWRQRAGEYFYSGSEGAYERLVTKLGGNER